MGTKSWDLTWATNSHRSRLDPTMDRGEITRLRFNSPSSKKETVEFLSGLVAVVIVICEERSC